MPRMSKSSLLVTLSKVWKPASGPAADAYIAVAAWLFFVLVCWLNLRLLATVSFEPLYCLPIAALAWWSGARGAYLMAIAAMLAGIVQSSGVTPDRLPAWTALYRATSEAVLYGGVAFVVLLARSQFDRLNASSRLLSRLAFHDRLTDLPNRPLLFDRLATAISQARRSHSKVGLLFLDLDGFKTINDKLGHKAGDDVLKAVASRLLGSVRDSDTVARLGGDEFAVVLCEIDGANAAAAVAEKILKAMAGPVRVRNGDTHVIGISIGISIFPECGAEIDSLLARADAAMYESKRAGKNRYTFFRDVSADGSPSAWIAYDATHAVGVAEIDEQHRQLMALANRLNTSVNAGESAEIVSQLFDELVLYAQFHFSTEERLMAMYAYPEQQQHKVLHARLVEEVGQMRERLSQGGEVLALQTIKDWLLTHIELDDREFGAYLNRCGVR